MTVKEDNGKVKLAEPVVEVSLDLDSYTNGELEDLEDQVGGNLPGLLERGKPPPQKVMNGLVWLTLRRTRPQVTLDEVRGMRGSAWAILPLDPQTASGGAGRNAPTDSQPSAPSTG